MGSCRRVAGAECSAGVWASGMATWVPIHRTTCITGNHICNLKSAICNLQNADKEQSSEFTSRLLRLDEYMPHIVHRMASCACLLVLLMNSEQKTPSVHEMYDMCRRFALAARRGGDPADVRLRKTLVVRFVNSSCVLHCQNVSSIQASSPLF